MTSTLSVPGLVYSRSIGYVRGVLQNRSLILQLTLREFRARHLGSGLGLLWSFMHPGIMLLIYWLVFTYAMPSVGSNPIAGAPFLVWILAGMVPWFIASDCIAGGTGAVTDNRFLVKKVVFQVSLLPVVRLLSALPVHLFLLLVVIGICWGRGYAPGWYDLQVFYYLFALISMGMGWTLLMSALVPFVKDVGQVAQVILQIGFWTTPLIWHIEGATDYHKALAYLNPLCYIVQGYRESLVYHVPFWHHPVIGAYYWGFTLILLATGGIVFSRLQAHFADVL